MTENTTSKRRYYDRTTEAEHSTVDAADRAFIAAVLAFEPSAYHAALRRLNSGAPDLMARDTIPPSTDERRIRQHHRPAGRDHAWRNKDQVG